MQLVPLQLDQLDGCTPFTKEPNVRFAEDSLVELAHVKKTAAVVAAANNNNIRR